MNVVNLLQYFEDNGMCEGDYIIVEDTSADAPAQAGMGGEGDALDYERYGNHKLELVQEFCARNTNYKVDSKYCDMFGFNATWNWNGYLRKMEEPHFIH